MMTSLRWDVFEYGGSLLICLERVCSGLWVGCGAYYWVLKAQATVRALAFGGGVGCWLVFLDMGS